MKRAVDNLKNNKSNIYVLVVRTFLILILLVFLYNTFLLVFSAKTENQAKYLFGFRAYVITTESMKPSLKKGDIIIIQKTKKERIYKNDIVTYKIDDGSQRITHRIVDIVDKFYVTKGDNNKLEDQDTVVFENIEGKLIYKMPFIGRLFLEKETLLYTIFMTIIILTFYLYHRRSITKSEIRREKKRYADRLRDAQEVLEKQNNEKEN